MNNFIFREAKIKDLKDVLRLNLELFKEEYKKFDKTLNLNWTYSNAGRRYFRKRITKDDGFVGVAEHNRKVIGYVCGGFSERLFYRKKARYAELENMIVENKFRGKGIGKRLTEDFRNWCKEKKIDYITVTTSVKNELALNFYRKQGFKDYILTLEQKL